MDMMARRRVHTDSPVSNGDNATTTVGQLATHIAAEALTSPGRSPAAEYVCRCHGQPELIQIESRYPENHEQDSQQGDQLANSSLESQHFTLQLGGIYVEHIEGHDFDRRGVEPTSRRRTGNATLDSASHVLCRPDKLSKPVVISILSAGCGNHGGIMVPPVSASTTCDHITRADRL